LLIEHMSYGGIIQAGDRLVTLEDSHGLKIFEEVSNKALVFEAADAIITVTYAGRALFGGKFTDHWLAELLTGEEISMSLPRGIRIGPEFRRMKLSDVFFRVWQALSVPNHWLVRRGQWYRTYFELSLLGWKWNHRYFQPFVLRFKKPSGTRRFDYQFETISPSRMNRYFWASFPDMNLTRAELIEIKSDIQNHSDYWGNIEDAFARAIQRVSLKEPRVGSHSITVSIPNPGFSRLITVKYHKPDNENLIYHLDGPGGESLNVMTTPWIIGGGVITPPQVLSGGSASCTDAFEIRCIAPINENSHIKFSSSSLARVTDIDPNE